MRSRKAALRAEIGLFIAALLLFCLCGAALLYRQVLEENGVKGAHVSLNDKGAVECVIRARVETAIRRGEGERDQ